MTTSPTTGRRDRKKAETRATLQWAALRLAKEHGYEHVTVEAITQAADVSVRTFFNYFATKEDALLGTDEARAEAALPALLADRPADEPIVTALRAVLAEIAEQFVENDALWQARTDLLHTSPQLWPKMFAHFTEFERALTEAIARRTGRNADTDIYPAVVAASVVAVVRVAITHWRTSGENASLADLLTSSLDVLASGLAIPLPQQPIDGAQS
ncbi:MAG: hypothetical protein QOF57_2592 [Frankiaceae bacterium]|jgi:AcrR family transcriptional regulator|nr:hypothetical protein [Frankiaceae bacterium]MDQ1726486.1 hypothetical protein [Frankiaceae bacterium]